MNKTKENLLLWVFASVIACAFVFGNAFAQASKAGEDKSKSELSRIKREITQKEKLIMQLKSKETSILSVIGEIEERISKGRQKIRDIERDKNSVSGEISALRGEIEKLKFNVRDKERDIRDRLRVSYKMGRFGFLEILLSARDYSDFQRKRYYLETLIRGERQMLEGYLAAQDEIASKLADLEGKEERLKGLIQSAGQNLSDIEKNRSSRMAVLKAVRGEKDLQERKSQELSKAAKDLEVMMQKMAPASGGISGDFASYRGALSLPAAGRIERGYGEYFNRELNVKMSSKGIELSVSRESDVRAVAAGSVIFAGPFRGYGEMIILDHGSGYYTLYARLNSLTKKAGERVKTGEKIGIVGGGDNIFGGSLYFELRNMGVPQDPRPWFKDYK